MSNESKKISEKIIGKTEIPKSEIKPPYHFNTGQTNIVMPTSYLIKQKNSDFRIVLAISGISNCDNVKERGENTRYVTTKKLDRHTNSICNTIGIEPGTFIKNIRKMLKHKSDEFKLTQRYGVNGTLVWCYQIDYEAGGFVTIPIRKAERCLLALGNNPIKLYCNLLWLCQRDGEFFRNHIPQSVLAELMGLSPRSENIVKASMQTLINEDLIKVTKVTERITNVNEDNIPYYTITEKLYYEIIVDEENDNCEEKKEERF